MFMHGVAEDKYEQICKELKDRYLGTITSTFALGLKLRQTGEILPDDGSPAISEEFLFCA